MNSLYRRLRCYFLSYDKGDWEVVGYLVIIVLMVALVPLVYFWSYLQSADFSWWWLTTKFFLTKSLENWWLWVLDKLSRLW